MRFSDIFGISERALKRNYIPGLNRPIAKKNYVIIKDLAFYYAGFSKSPENQL